MGKNNIKQRNEEYERRTKLRKSEKLARLAQEYERCDDDFDLPLNP